MSSKAEDWTGALNIINNGEQLATYNRLSARYFELNRALCVIVEMECMSEQEYILEVYDQAIGTGYRVIHNEFPVATTHEEFEGIIAKLEEAVSRLEAVERVIRMCFERNFIRISR